jgi:hypothetical protein
MKKPTVCCITGEYAPYTRNKPASIDTIEFDQCFECIKLANDATVPKLCKVTGKKFTVNQLKCFIRRQMEKYDLWLEKAIYRIWLFQEYNEQSHRGTILANKRGFNKPDSYSLSGYGEYIHYKSKRGTEQRLFGHILEIKDLKIARKKMLKYAGQLARYINHSDQFSRSTDIYEDPNVKI